MLLKLATLIVVFLIILFIKNSRRPKGKKLFRKENTFFSSYTATINHQNI